MPAAETLKRLAETITGEELYTDMKWSWTEDKEGNVDKEFRIVLDMLEQGWTNEASSIHRRQYQ